MSTGVLVRWGLALVVVAAAWGPPGAAWAQEPASASLAAELSSALAERELEAMAARDAADEEDRFVAALAFPGQLLVVSARYEVPTLIEQKIANGDYREVYIDLNAASIAGSKVLVTDLGANGLRASDRTVDMFTTDEMTLRLDGDGSGGQLSDEEYESAVADADERYARMLNALIGQVR